MIHYITYLQYIHTFIYVYTDIYMVEYYSAFKKEILPISIMWLNLEDITLSEKSQMQKDKYHRTPLL